MAASKNTILFSFDESATPDLKIGVASSTHPRNYPVPIPKDLWGEVLEYRKIRHTEVHQTDDFRVVIVDTDTVNLRVQNSGDVTNRRDMLIGRYVQVNGNQIKSSSGQTVVTMAGASATIHGGLTVEGLSSTIRGLFTVENFTTLQNMQAINGTFTGSITAGSKAFNIPHPSPGMEAYRLEHGSLEGPEHAVYFRGTARAFEQVEYPSYWKDLVDMDSITIHITPMGSTCRWPDVIQTSNGFSSSHDQYSYLVMGTRKDVPHIIVEQLSPTS